MAQVKVTTYFCDRCEDQMEEPAFHGQTIVRAHAVGEFAPEWRIDWSELCAPCRRDIANFFATRPVRLKRKEDALKDWTK